MASRRQPTALFTALAVRLGRRRWIGAGLVALLLLALLDGRLRSLGSRSAAGSSARSSTNIPSGTTTRAMRPTSGAPRSPVLMAFVHHESSFRSDARPPREYILGFIPWGRVSSAKGLRPGAGPGLVGLHKTSADRSGAAARTSKTPSTSSAGTTSGTSQRAGHSPRMTHATALSRLSRRPRRLSAAGTWKEQAGKVQQHGEAGWRRRRSRYRGPAQATANRTSSCDSWYQFWPFCS